MGAPVTTTRYVLMKVDIEHEPGADVDRMMLNLQSDFDEDEGHVIKSELLDVYTENPQETETI